MNESILQTPQLCSMSQCDVGLNFSPRSEWPLGLPAVALNSVILAGFSQEMVFNHQIDFKEDDKIAGLFRSLYFEMTFVEMARLIEKSKKYSWFPISKIALKFGWQPTEQFFKLAELVLKTPFGFQNWCAEKKVSTEDLLPLISAQDLNLEFLFQDIPNLALSKSLGIKALELGIELILLGQKPENLSAQRMMTFLFKNQTPSEGWIEALKQLRHPEAFKRDQEQAEKMASLPWPGSSHAKWTRHGDQSGIELKLFVTQPSDLKKYLQSLNRIQDLLDKESSGTKH